MNALKEFRAPAKPAAWTGVYVTREARPVTFWERGTLRYLIMSYSIWAGNIKRDVTGKNKKGEQVRRPGLELRRVK